MRREKPCRARRASLSKPFVRPYKRLCAGILALCLLFAGDVPAGALEPEGALPFHDVSPTQWYHAPIAYCVEKGYMRGQSETQFAPTGRVNRAQVAQVLYNLAGNPNASALKNPFRDVGNGWFTDAVKWCRAEGIVNGVTETSFAPLTPVTREQAAVMFKRYHAFTGAEDIPFDSAYFNRFADREHISSWAVEGMNWAVQYGLVSGMTENLIAPRGDCTRAQLAQIIQNYFEPQAVMPPEEEPLPPSEVLGPFTNSSLVCFTRLSPNHSGPRNHAIDTITIHCMAENYTIEQCGSSFANPARKASSNYGIGSDGRIALYVDEANRSWCSSSAANDNRAVTIEVANISGAPDYPVSRKAYAALLDLVTDICWRNNIKRLLWQADETLIGQVDKQNMTVHRWFANKSCPGEYLYSRHSAIAAEVNKRLAAMEAASSVFSFRALENLTGFGPRSLG